MKISAVVSVDICSVDAMSFETLVSRKITINNIFTMKKLTLLISLFAFMATANAQIVGKYSAPEDTYTMGADGKIVKKERRGLFDRNKTEKVIDKKYLEGACPEVNGKVQWDESIEVPGKTAKQLYDSMLKFLQAFSKSNGMTDRSKVAVVNETDNEIGASMQEWLVFENKPLSLDQTKFNYQLVVRCYDGKCALSMRNMSYVYEEERGGGAFPAEEMISDAEALNKAKTGFQKGGVRKFRMKTIDRKDQIFKTIREYLTK